MRKDLILKKILIAAIVFLILASTLLSCTGNKGDSSDGKDAEKRSENIALLEKKSDPEKAKYLIEASNAFYETASLSESVAYGKLIGTYQREHITVHNEARLLEIKESANDKTGFSHLRHENVKTSTKYGMSDQIEEAYTDISGYIDGYMIMGSIPDEESGDDPIYLKSACTPEDYKSFLEESREDIPKLDHEKLRELAKVELGEDKTFWTLTYERVTEDVSNELMAWMNKKFEHLDIEFKLDSINMVASYSTLDFSMKALRVELVISTESSYNCNLKFSLVEETEYRLPNKNEAKPKNFAKYRETGDLRNIARAEDIIKDLASSSDQRLELLSDLKISNIKSGKEFFTYKETSDMSYGEREGKYLYLANAWIERSGGDFSSMSVIYDGTECITAIDGVMNQRTELDDDQARTLVQTSLGRIVFNPVEVTDVSVEKSDTENKISLQLALTSELRDAIGAMVGGGDITVKSDKISLVLSLDENGEITDISYVADILFCRKVNTQNTEYKFAQSASVKNIGKADFSRFFD